MRTFETNIEYMLAFKTTKNETKEIDNAQMVDLVLGLSFNPKHIKVMHFIFLIKKKVEGHLTQKSTCCTIAVMCNVSIS